MMMINTTRESASLWGERLSEMNCRSEKNTQGKNWKLWNLKGHCCQLSNIANKGCFKLDVLFTIL